MAVDGSAENQKPFQRLPRSFSLKRKRLIRPLFDRRRSDVGSINHGCIRILYRLVPRSDLTEDVPLQVGFAPGRLPMAVRRNHIKRVLREVYRVNQHDLVGLFSDRSDALTMMIVYRGRPDQDGALIRADLPVVLDELRRRLGETSMSPERRL